MKLKCTCQVESTEFEKTSNIQETKERSGFGFIWNISNGLTALWLCENCYKQVKDHWNQIVKITKTDLIQIPRK